MIFKMMKEIVFWSTWRN